MSRAVVLVLAGCAALLVAYGSRVIFDVPLLDDWSFVEQLQRYLAGECSLPQYLLARHNEHLAIPSRLLFLLLYHWTALDLRVLRWLTLAVLFACAVIVACAVSCDVARSPGSRSARDRAAELILWLPFAAMTASLAGWETVAVAMSFTNAVALLATLSAVLAFERWRGRASIGNCLSTFGLTLLATVSLGSGLLLWFVLAVAATCSWRLRRRRLETALLWLLGLGFLAAQVVARSAALQQSAGVGLALAVVEVAGVPLALQQHGEPDAAMCLLSGAGLVVALGLSSVHHARRGAELRARSTRYLLWGWAGFATCAAIALGRHGLPGVGSLAASRYVPMVLPLALGSLAYWICTAATRRAASRVACGVALGITCLGLAIDFGELRMSRSRANACTSMITLLSGDLAKVPEVTWRTQLYLEPWLAQQVAQRNVPFLRAHELSLFRPPRGQ
ncbi:MAG TPA: hypothetical protein VF384_13585 [Planctomycetota bacterium]